MRHQVGLKLREEVHGHHDHDEQRGTTEYERHAALGDQQLGQQADRGDVDRAPQRESREHLVDVFAGLLTRADAADEGARLLEVVGRLARVEHQRRVEEAEEDDQYGVRHDVRGLAIAESGAEGLQRVAPPGVVVLPGETGDGRREQQQARREDRRDHARHVELERQMRGLALHHAATHLLLGVVDRDATLRTLDEHAEGGDTQHHHDERDGDEARHFAGIDLVDRLADRVSRTL